MAISPIMITEVSRMPRLNNLDAGSKKLESITALPKSNLFKNCYKMLYYMLKSLISTIASTYTLKANDIYFHAKHPFINKLELIN